MYAASNFYASYTLPAGMTAEEYRYEIEGIWEKLNDAACLLPSGRHRWNLAEFANEFKPYINLAKKHGETMMELSLVPERLANASIRENRYIRSLVRIFGGEEKVNIRFWAVHTLRTLAAGHTVKDADDLTSVRMYGEECFPPKDEVNTLLDNLYFMGVVAREWSTTEAKHYGYRLTNSKYANMIRDRYGVKLKVVAA